MNKAFQFVSQDGAAGDNPEKAAKRVDLQGRAASAEGTAEQLNEGEIPGAAHKAVEDQIAGIESEARQAGLEITEATRAKDKLAAKALEVMLRREQEDAKHQDSAPGASHETRDFLDDPFGWLLDMLAAAGEQKLQEIGAAADAGAQQQMLEYLQKNPDMAENYLNQNGERDFVKAAASEAEPPAPQGISGGGNMLRDLVARFQAEQGGAPLPKFNAECLGGRAMPSTGPSTVCAAGHQRSATPLSRC